ncbi:olfactory receptor 6N1-like [Eleutherodactylus coqui]|uniref:olfactory receptor 6N1-like n=1 Tax=Eleutherodactylus coqui TaxID=57060 RepID=UPI0034619BE5
MAALTLLTLASINVASIKSDAARFAAFDFLSRVEAAILFLQETRLTDLSVMYKAKRFMSREYGATNSSDVTDFTLLGFHTSTDLKRLMFILILKSYLITLMANILIITVVQTNSQLQVPMYHFLSHFSVLEIGYTTVVIPKMLVGLLADHVTISRYGCLTQFYFVFFSGTVENVLLAVMGYDRYLAICNPLHYSSIMTQSLCCQMAFAAWICGCFIPVMPTIGLAKLDFCGDKRIDHFFCDFGPLVKLSSSDTSVVIWIFFGQSCVLIPTCCLLIIISYTFIISTILNIPSTSGCQKAFSTCASHFTVVSIFYATIIFMYVRPSAANTFRGDKMISVFYSVVTPLLNPIIYSLRNASIKEAMQTMTKKLLIL